MNTAPTNILNLLLGIVPAQPGPVNSAVAPTGEQPSFDLLFGSLLGAKTSGNEAVDTFLGQATAAEQTSEPKALFSTDLKALLEGRLPLPTTGIQSSPAQVVSNADGDDDGDYAATINGKQPLFGTGAIETTNPFAPLSQQNDTLDVRALMALMPTGTVGTANRDLNSIPVDLPEGDYRILDWSVTNGNLNLQLASADSAADSLIRVSLPLNSLNLSPETAKLVNPTGWQRFDLDGSTDQSRQLLKAFEAVNLKELKIEIANPSVANTATDSSKPIQLTLVAANVGQEVAIKANINRNEIRARISTDPNAIATKSDGTPRSYGQGETRTVVSAQAAILGAGRAGSADGRLLSGSTVGGFDLFAKASNDSPQSGATAQVDQMSAL
ncbi:MAG: hypothetical protein KKA81_16270, partial [Bacteroidetes bacterium]|nr:hypothetical protein [Bacteroidota bacterium]